MSNLPEVSFASRNTADIEQAVITGYETASGRSLAKGDPVRLFLLSIAALIAQQRSLIDHAGKMNLLHYSEGDFLDQIGSLVGVTRLDPQSAITTFEFTLSSVQGSVYTIPTGTEITTGNVSFLTTETLEIPIGETVGQVTGECAIAGESGNGYLPGQIKILVQPLPFVQSVTNISESTGGADLESDANLKERIRQAPGQFSVAGPDAAYVYWARTANQNIIDVSVHSPTPGIVEIRPLMKDGELPSLEIIDVVDGILSAKLVRPLTDNVNVMAPTGVSYDIDIEYWINTDDSTQSATIQSKVTAAVDEYRLWQRSKIGRDINPDELLSRVKAAGAKRVVINSPVFTVLTVGEVAQEGAVTTTYQGLEDA